MHCILFVILQVGWKFERYTDKEMADIKSTAVSLGDWFDMDEDECLDTLDETLDLLKKSESAFDIETRSSMLTQLCLHINSGITNEGAREDIIRFMNDQAKADGKVTEAEKTNLNYYSTLIRIGDVMFGEE